MSIYATLGVPEIINACGTVTRLSGGLMAPEVAEAMRQASLACVDMVQLQAAASRIIREATGAEAGIVTSGASAGVLLGTAAILAGLDPARMNALPEVADGRREFIMVRSQRNMYDKALMVAGARIVEVGIPDRYSGPGVRDAAPWELEAAITKNTAGIYYLAGAQSKPGLREIAAVAREHRLPILVDAAGQLPPSANLRRFLDEGADLVAFSGGKALGGPQASGILAGRRDLVMAAALQHLDLDVFWDLWDPPPGLIDKTRLKGAPQHGIGRSCKAGKEEIAGLLTALRLFIAEGDATRHARWLKDCQAVAAGLEGHRVTITGAGDITCVPSVEIALESRQATALCLRLQRGSPAIALDPAARERGVVTVSPMCLKPGEAEIVAREIRRALSEL